MTGKSDKERDKERTRQHKAAGLVNVKSYWVRSEDRDELLRGIKKVAKPLQDRARRQLKKWKDEQEN